MKQEKTFILNNESADMISGEVREFLETNESEDSIVSRISIAVEKLIVKLHEGVEENTPLTLTLSKKAGRLWIRMEYKGKRFNPIDRDQMNQFSDHILAGLEIKPIWIYYMGLNRITMVVPSSGDRAERLLAGAFFLSLIAGSLQKVIPQEAVFFINTYVLTPVSDMFIKLLTVLAPMLIFLSIVNSIVQNGRNRRRYATLTGERMKFLLPARLSAQHATRCLARPYTARIEPDAKTFSIRTRRKQRRIKPAK